MVSPQKKIEKMFEILEQGPRSVTKMSKLAKMHFETVMNYVDLVIYIQGMPKIEKIVSDRTTLVRIRQD